MEAGHRDGRSHPHRAEKDDHLPLHRTDIDAEMDGFALAQEKGVQARRRAAASRSAEAHLMSSAAGMRLSQVVRPRLP